MNAQSNQSSKSGLWIPWLFVGFFGIVVIVNGVMIWIATTTWTGLDTQQAYEKGLAYNQLLEAAEAQSKLGWRSVIDAEWVDGASARIEVQLNGANGLAINDAELIARLERPNRTIADFDTTLQPLGDGRYRAVIDLPEPGVWNLHLSAVRGDDLFVEDHRLVLH